MLFSFKLYIEFYLRRILQTLFINIQESKARCKILNAKFVKSNK